MTCFSCYESGLRTEIERAQHSTVWVWIFTGAVTAVAAISAVANPGTPVILVIPLAFVLSWCLFWGWTPVWKGFTKAVRGWIIGPTILLFLGFLVLGAIAILIGAGTGIQKYNDARRLVADGDQMIATLRHKDVQSTSTIKDTTPISW